MCWSRLRGWRKLCDNADDRRGTWRFVDALQICFANIGARRSEDGGYEAETIRMAKPTARKGEMGAFELVDIEIDSIGASHDEVVLNDALENCGGLPRP